MSLRMRRSVANFAVSREFGFVFAKLQVACFRACFISKLLVLWAWFFTGFSFADSLFFTFYGTFTVSTHCKT